MKNFYDYERNYGSIVNGILNKSKSNCQTAAVILAQIGVLGKDLGKMTSVTRKWPVLTKI
jgi:hypothetical protein